MTRPYSGDYAQYYDLFYADKPYAREAEFIHQLVQRWGGAQNGRLLDVACGTGRHALEMERLGYQVTGVDASADMIAVARERGRRAGVAWHVGDMRAFEVPGPRFDLVTCLFDSIGYATTNPELGDALRCIRAHLIPRGLAVLEFWHAAAMLRAFSPVRVRRWSTDDAEIVRISETTVDCARQVASVAYQVLVLRTDGSFLSFRDTQEARFFLVQEMDAVLRGSGLEPVQWCAGFADGAIGEETWHVVVVVRNAG